MDRNIYCLLYWSRDLFLWIVHHKSQIRNLKRGDGTTQKFLSGWYFHVWKFQFYLLASKYFMSVNNCSCSHINFGQTAVEGILILRYDLVFSTWAALKNLMDLNIAWACFCAWFPGTDMLAPAYVNARGWTSFWFRFAPVWQQMAQLCALGNAISSTPILEM